MAKTSVVTGVSAAGALAVLRVVVRWRLDRPVDIVLETLALIDLLALFTVGKSSLEYVKPVT
jgi:hypothetical protein